MMTLGRFRALLDSYGADPQRWPQALRANAQVLLSGSAAARAMHEEAERLDVAIAAATTREDARLARLSPPDEALRRLRSGVAARIAIETARPVQRRAGWTWVARVDRLLSPVLLSSRLQWAGMATAGGFAILAGLLLGAMYATPPSADPVLSMLQSSPIVILAD